MIPVMTVSLFSVRQRYHQASDGQKNTTESGNNKYTMGNRLPTHQLLQNS